MFHQLDETCHYTSIDSEVIERWLKQGLLQAAVGVDESIKTVDGFVEATKTIAAVEITAKEDRTLGSDSTP